MGQIAAALQVSCQRGVNQCPRAAAEEIQTPSLSLNADPSCWQAAADQRMAATNQLTVSRQPANNPSHSIQPGSAAEEYLLYHLLMEYHQSRYFVWGMEVFFIRPNFQL